MNEKLPWLKFFPSDWLSDEGLRSCSVAARGLWMDLLALMTKSNTHGYLLIGGMPPSVDQIAKIVGEDTATTRKLLEELESHRVFSRDVDNVVFSRRMRRDEEKRKGNADRQSRFRSRHNEESDFHPPTHEEWMAYAKTIKGWDTINAESSFDHYQSNGWKIGGRAPMTDWRACARNCARRHSQNETPPRPTQTQRPKPAVKSSCESPRVSPTDYGNLEEVVSMIHTEIGRAHV